MQKLHKLALYLAEDGMKLMLSVDELNGDENIRMARKGLVKSMNHILDRLEKLKTELNVPSLQNESS
ncbi:hypothetical protein GUITHDRAFT_152778 [Guillardia theta CCMP2712]|uniref:BAG domain-containing protein n=1 Tax=Guillardia theta (strain CCMP2712) TaxID=905079 RepID=L1JAX2_GUITC|nr:hypothetical protein GUITHDRAFT_152778 [Guillardia theta CCMP2712]EKX45244.1 hypothetical protein GUITHDRAFT_152778 [Guillardia theta CCMP2712]|eukprot:XP_005832224.1 hypothetical protein GUITHDRAFT_152778 [Guillardia theta CCMP2712]